MAVYPTMHLMHPKRETLRGSLLELFAPTRCVGCNLPGQPFCPECEADAAWIDQRWSCPVCGAPFGWLTCTGCKRDWKLPVVCAAGFEDAIARMVLGLKDQHNLVLAGVMARFMARAFTEALSLSHPTRQKPYKLALPDAILYVPATRRAFARRGYDHMELVARELSHILGIPIADALVRAEGLDQRSLNKEQRYSNLENSIQITGDVAGAKLLLIDDVVTTGASMQACASALLGRGSCAVYGCAMARVW